VVLDENLAAPPLSENRDVVLPPVLELAQVAATAILLPTVEVPEPSPAAEVPSPPRLRRWRRLLRLGLPSPLRR
jgi:hypothetical protein